MTNSKSTKRALLSSAFAILICVAMLIGTTFAWFTDTASTAVNKIQAGNLDVALEMKEGENWVSAEGKTLTFKTADNRAADKILWEPGCTYELPQLRVVNKGNLALKYKVLITGITGDAKLNEAIEWTIGDVASGVEQHLLAGANNEFTIKGHMKEDAGNEYQGLSIDGIAITVYATQYTYENDSINDQYDKNAAYKGSQEFTEGTYTLDKGGVALATDARPVAVYATGNKTDVTITGGYYDGGKGGDYNVCVWADNGANVTIKDGTFTVGADKDGNANSVIYSTGGNITIEGGFFYTNYSWNGKYYVLNQKNDNPGTITVKGGTFVNYNPAGGDDIRGGNFVDDGYSVISETKANGDVWYTVVKGTGIVPGTQEELNNGIKNSADKEVTVVLPKSSSFTLDNGIAHEGSKSRDITFVGDGSQTIDIHTDDVGENGNRLNYQRGSTFVFENLNIKGNTSTYEGIVAKKLTYKNCTLTNMQCLYGEEVEFINCTFNQTADDSYHLWTYGAKNVTFTGCTFNSTSKSKAILCYTEQAEGTLVRTFNNCTFKAVGVAEKSAIMVNPTAYNNVNTYIVNINNCKAEGYAENGIAGQTVVGIKQTVKDNITINIDGVTVYSNN